jgi:serine/threonine protein kinase
MGSRLLVLAGPDEGKTFPLQTGEALLLGRSRATEGRLIDPHVSRVHCQVQTDGAHTTVTDFDSAGGTFVNGKKIQGKEELKPGDLIRIGNTRLQFFAEEGETAGNTAAAEVPLAIPAKRAPTTLSWATGLVGKKLSHYKIGPILARSRSGYVFHARDTNQNLPVALKVLEPRFSKNASAVQRFVRAMKTVMPLRHPNLVTVYSAGKTGPHCWIAMEYVPGESLAAVIGRIETAGMLDWRQVLRFAAYIARAIEFAHKKKILHRNINPQNILLGNKPADTKLTDLMLAKALEGENAEEITKTGEILGDFPYLSPEATTGGAHEVDGRTDIYSMGATIYAMLTGHPPFEGETVTELVIKIRREQPVPLKTLFLGAPPEFEQIVEKMMAKRPADRFATATELLQALEGLAKEKNVAV